MNEPTYSSLEVSRVSGLTYRQVDYYDRSGLLKPSVRERQGSGSQRRYSADDLRRAVMVKAMLDRGVSLQRIRGAVAFAGGFWAGVADIVVELRALETLIADLVADLGQMEVSA